MKSVICLVFISAGCTISKTNNRSPGGGDSNVSSASGQPESSKDSRVKLGADGKPLGSATGGTTVTSDPIPEKPLDFVIGPESPLKFDSVPGDFYVLETGSDANDCSITKPCRQIRKAVGLAKVGGTIVVGKGSYAGFTVDTVANAAKPLKIIAPGKDAQILVTTDRPDNRDTIYITGAAYVIIDGLNANFANRSGVRVDQCDHITIRNGRFSYNPEWGIFTDFTTNSIYENNELAYSVNQHGIYDSNSPQNSIIRRNISHDNFAAGIQINADASMGGSGLSEGNLIESNIVYRNGKRGGSAINLDGVQNSTVQNNLLYDNYATGIVFYQGDGAAGPKGNNVFYNTVVMSKTQSRNALLMFAIAGKNQIANNIFLAFLGGKASYNFSNQGEATQNDYYNNIIKDVLYEDSNTFLSISDWQKFGKDLGSFFANTDEIFNSPSTNDYTLKTHSVAIGKGKILEQVKYDIYGRPRDLKISSDIGAYLK